MEQTQETSFADGLDSSPRGVQTITTTQGIAILVFALSVLLPVFWFVQADFHGMFRHPRLMLLSVTAVGAAVSLALVVRTGQRRRALVPGLLMGAGCAGMVVLLKANFPALAQLPKVGELFLLLAMFLGSFPGLMVWVKLQVRKPSRPTTPPSPTRG